MFNLKINVGSCYLGSYTENNISCLIGLETKRTIVRRVTLSVYTLAIHCTEKVSNDLKTVTSFTSLGLWIIQNSGPVPVKDRDGLRTGAIAVSNMGLCC